MDNDVRQAAEDRREGEAVRNARQRIAQLGETVGVRHSEYATGLNQLALLLIMQGDPGAAEPLLRESLEIRGEVLGENHPDYATNLSSLGGLLWARGALDQAEPLLRKAAEVRAATLGAAHPKTLVSVNSLEQLLALTRASGGVVLTTTPADPFGGMPVVPVPTQAGGYAGSPDLDDFARSLELLRGDFSALGDQLIPAAEQFRAGGAPPSEELLLAVSSARSRFASLVDRAKAAAGELGLAPEECGPTSLADLVKLAPTLRAAATARTRDEADRRKAIALVERVERLACPSQSDFGPLAACRRAARQIKRGVLSAERGGLADEARRLVEGTHPLNSVLSLIGADETTADGEWADWYDAVESAFGSSLAVAIARTRIVADASPEPAAS